MTQDQTGPYEAKVVADSIAHGVRLTTLMVTFPRFVLAEFNTHRMFSRNSASSRAIPVKKRIAQIEADPYVPLAFGKKKRGMQAGEPLEEQYAKLAEKEWRDAVAAAVNFATLIEAAGVHKQWANRVIETYAWHTVIVTATEWANWDALRISEFAQPEICKAAEAMKAAREASTPRHLSVGQWHLPFVDRDQHGFFVEGDDFPIGDLIKLSVSRCAAVSFMRHLDHDVVKDISRYEKLFTAKHMSPFEHAARVAPIDVGNLYHYRPPFAPRWALREGIEPKPNGDVPPGAWVIDGYFCGNFRAPWLQHRKLLPGEAVWCG
jgi:thymidylate synthase ThyX